jgi:hypothetical protein
MHNTRYLPRSGQGNDARKPENAHEENDLWNEAKEEICVAAEIDAVPSFQEDSQCHLSDANDDGHLHLQ